MESLHHPEEVARTIIPSFPVELQLKFVLWDPLGPPRGVPVGPRGSQRDPEEELRSVFNGKVARNNDLKNDFFLIFNVEGPFQRYLPKTS